MALLNRMQKSCILIQKIHELSKPIYFTSNQALGILIKKDQLDKVNKLETGKTKPENDSHGENGSFVWILEIFKRHKDLYSTQNFN